MHSLNGCGGTGYEQDVVLGKVSEMFDRQIPIDVSCKVVQDEDDDQKAEEVDDDAPAEGAAGGSAAGSGASSSAAKPKAKGGKAKGGGGGGGGSAASGKKKKSAEEDDSGPEEVDEITPQPIKAMLDKEAAKRQKLGGMQAFRRILQKG